MAISTTNGHTTNGHTPNGHATGGQTGVNATAGGHRPHGRRSNGRQTGQAKNATSRPVASADAASTQIPEIGPMRVVTLGDIAKLLGAELVGDAQTLISGVASLDATSPGMISFIENERLLKTALDSQASAIIAPESLSATMRHERKGGKPAVFTGNPRLAFAKVMEFLQPLAIPEPGIHPTAVIEPDAYISEGVAIGAFCYVGHHAHIGNGAVLYPHVFVGDGAQVGDASILYPSVVLNHHVHIGQRVRIHSGSVLGGDGFGYVMDKGVHHKVPQVGTVIIEDDVEIGANVTIDRATMGATRVGAGTKIDNLVQIAHNVQIGRNCILCGQAGLGGSAVVEDNAVIAGQVGLRDHVTVGKGAIVGAQSGIMNDIAPGDFVTGTPAVLNREFMRVEAASRKLPETMRALRKLERQVQALQEQLDTLTGQSNVAQIDSPEAD